MHGVPADLPLAHFVHCSLIQIGIGQFQLQFHFSGEGGVGGGSISVEGGWELRDATGVPIDHAQEHFEHEHYTLHVLLGHSISDLSIDAPRSFQLVFDSGHRLTIYDDNEHYETFSVNPAGQAGVYI